MIRTKFIPILGILLLAGAMGLGWTSTALAQIPTSDSPVLDEPVFEGAEIVTGVTSEGEGTTITVFVDGSPAPISIAGPGGFFLVHVWPLVAGQHLNATAQAIGEFESVPSSPDVIVQAGSPTPQCQDGFDNDFDGLTDLDDPGCVDANDDDEFTQCQDAIDNDDDGLTDLDDPGCEDANDDDETNVSPPEPEDSICNSPVKSIVELRAEVELLTTSEWTKNVLKWNLSWVETALSNGNNKIARNRMENFISTVVNRSNFREINPHRILLDESNSLICGAANLLIGIELP